MKKLLSVLTLALALIIGGSVATAQSTLSKKETKAIEKDVKNRSKQLKKAGWEPLASLSTMENSMLKYRMYMAEDEDNRIAITGIAAGKNNKIGRENAIHSGIASYAARAKAQIVGKIKSVMKSENGSDYEDEIDKFGAAYESGVNTRISGLVKEHFTLVRVLPNGSKEFNVFMSIDETAARKAREEAARQAKEQSSMQNLTEMVDEFIGEPVAPMD